MGRWISKSAFRGKALECFREVESTGAELVITDRGKPVLKIVPFTHDPEKALRSLRGTAVRFTHPLEPVGKEECLAEPPQEEPRGSVAELAGVLKGVEIGDPGANTLSTF